MKKNKPNSKKIADPKDEFRRLLALSGWSQAEASRQLCMTPSALSQIIRHNSPVRPSTVSLRLFKLLVWREKPDVLQATMEREEMPGLDLPEQALIRRLRGLSPEAKRKVLRTFMSMIDLTAGPEVKVAGKRGRRK